MLNAAENGDLEVVARLIKLADEDEDMDPLELVNAAQHGFSPLMCAAMNGHCDVLQELLRKGADVGRLPCQDGDVSGPLLCDSALTVAAEHLGTIQQLLNTWEGLQSSDEVDQLLQKMDQNEGVDPVLVVDGGPNTCAASWVAVLGAAGLNTQNSLPVLKQLMEKRAAAGLQIDFRDGTAALMQALIAHQIDVMAILLDAGMDPDQRDYGGYTALMHASEAGNAAATALLLEKNADRDVRSSAGWTACMMAAEVQHGHGLPVLELMLAERQRDPEHPVPDLDWQDPSGYSALLLAAERRHLEIVQLLVKCGATLDLHSVVGGGTPLMAATQARCFPIAKALMTAGARPESEREDRCNTLSVAEVHGEQSLARILRDKGFTNPRVMSEQQKAEARAKLDAELDAELAARNQ
eukprot:COSAG05_NODE_1719_length_4218_cov_6.536295_3_plen_410_part_00